MTPTKIYIGEVYSYDECYKKPEKYFKINVLVRETDNSTSKLITGVVPVSNNLKQMPILGENVLIFEGYDEKTKTGGAPDEQNKAAPEEVIQRQVQWYYFSLPINVRFNVKENITYSNSSDRTYPAAKDKEFEEIKKLAIASLQPFKGDTLIEGRWGSTIRLGSTSKEDPKYYAVSPPWKGSIVTDPIIVISNGQLKSKKQPNKEFKVENTQLDASSIYLTTTQKINNLSLGGNKKNPLTYYKNESKFDKSQFIAIADRTILKSKSDIAVIDSPKAIVLNTTGLIKLGNDKADQPLPHGWVLYKILQNIITQMKKQIQCGTMIGTYTDFSALNTAQSELKSLLNKNFYITKNTF